MAAKKRPSPLDVLHSTSQRIESPTEEDSAVLTGEGRSRDAAATGTATQVYNIPPSHLTPWPFANRRRLDSEAFDELTEMIRDSGQRLPALVRRIKPTPPKGEPSYEIIYGVRRWHVAKRLDIPLKAVITDIDDRDAALAMDHENRGHADISVMDRARDYKAWYDGGLFETKDAIANAASMNRTTLYRMFQIADLPVEVEDAFREGKDISFTFAYDLSVKFNHAPERRDALIEVANRLAADKTSSKTKRQAALLAVFDDDETKSERRADTNQYRDIGDEDGRTIGRICVTRKGVIRFNTRQMPQEKANELAEEITNFLANYSSILGDSD